MPEPTAAIRLTALGHHETAVRATMLASFVTAWP
jgi:hypothetical protein